MELKSKGISWFGNIYQKLETVCHDVDNIVNQEAVKFVENRVQIVGESMKKICSDVVQIVDPVRCEAQAVAVKGNAAGGTYIKSMIGTKEDHGRIVLVGEPCLERSDFASMNASGGINVGCQSTVVTHVESSLREEFDLEEDVGVVSTNENCDVSIDGNAKEKCSAFKTLDLTGSLEDTDALQSEDLIDNDSDNDNDNENANSCVSLDEDASSTAVNGQDSLPSQEVETVYRAPVDVSGSISDISTDALKFQDLIDNDKENVNSCVCLDEDASSTSVNGQDSLPSQEVETVYCAPADVSGSVSDISTDALQSQDLIDNDKENANSCVSPDWDASSTGVDDQDSLSSEEVETVYCAPEDVSDSLSDISTDDVLSAMAFSVESSCGSIFTEPCTLPRSSLNDILAEIESDCNAVNETDHVSQYSGSLLSSASPAIISSNKEEEETGLTLSNSTLSAESTNKLVSLLVPVSTPIDYCNKGEVETGHSCSNSVTSTACSGGSTYVLDCEVDSGMKAIGLPDNLKLEESCVIVDNSMLYEVARRIQRQKSYKKKFQDAFNTRKRISKEYEQLAIWYGEIDTESCQDAGEQPLPSSNTVTLESDTQDSLDSEWELL